MAKVGRPSKFESINLNQVTRLASLGLTDVEIAHALDISEDSIYEYKNNHPEFSEALKQGKALSDSQVEKKLFERAIGYSHPETKVFCQDGQIITEEITKHHPPDPTSMIFWLKNRKRDEWRDRQEVEHSGEVKISEDHARTIRDAAAK